MTRCIVCGKKFNDDADTPGPGEVEIIQGAVKFYDPTRDKFVFRHIECPEKDYITKERREELNEKPPTPSKKIKMAEPPEVK